jgi:hypothetical protein
VAAIASTFSAAAAVVAFDGSELSVLLAQPESASAPDTANIAAARHQRDFPRPS